MECSTKIHEAHGTFTREQRARKINWSDISYVRREFGYLPGLQMGRDKQAGFAFWDSCSMIEQAWAKLSGVEVERFVSWALGKITEAN